jgi:hypothetical protein
MATTTPNYGWTVPTSTDLVKDGATAIETLGDAIDASMNTALGTKKAGMVLLNTTSFSAVASQSLPNDTFTSTYDSYRVVLRLSASGNTPIRMRFRTAGTDNSSSFYYATWIGVSAVSDTTLYMRSGAQNAGYLDTQSTTAPKIWGFDIHNPKLSTITFLLGHYSDNSSATAYNGGLIFSDTTSFDSFSFFTVTGGTTMTGDVKVYGYNK